MEFEVCIDSVEGARIAGKYGAKRVELCSALDEGGLTPSLAMIEACVKNSSAEVFVMIRPSSGGFNYSDDEIEVMLNDIKGAAAVNAHGVVFGVLDGENKVDVQKNLLLLEEARKHNLNTTFHRAIDVTPDPLEALQHIIHLGFNRVLTSGGKSKAADGIDLIKKLKEKAGNNLQIMAGSGINPENTNLFVKAGLEAIHFTARKKASENLPLNMGLKHEVDEEKIKNIATQLQ